MRFRVLDESRSPCSLERRCNDNGKHLGKSESHVNRAVKVGSILRGAQAKRDRVGLRHLWTFTEQFGKNWPVPRPGGASWADGPRRPAHPALLHHAASAAGSPHSLPAAPRLGRAWVCQTDIPHGVRRVSGEITKTAKANSELGVPGGTSAGMRNRRWSATAVPSRVRTAGDRRRHFPRSPAKTSGTAGRRRVDRSQIRDAHLPCPLRRGSCRDKVRRR